MRKDQAKNEFLGSDKDGNMYVLINLNTASTAGQFGLQTAAAKDLKSTVLNTPANRTRTEAQFLANTGGGTCTAPGGTGTTGGSTCGTGGAAGTTDPNAATEGEGGCDAGALTWIICPATGIVGGVVEILKGAVLDQLQYRLLNTNGSTTQNGASVKDSWEIFRNFTNALFVLIFVIMIFGTALGMDNYSIKKILPRLIAAAVLIQASFLIASFGVSASNVAGFGMAQLFGGLNPTDANMSQLPLFMVISNFLLVGGVTAGVVTAALAPGIIVPFALFALGLLLSLLTVFFTLQLRIILLTIFIVVSPLAILMWTLPNTERYFQLWRKWFVRLLLMYPMIGALFAGGNLVSDITIAANKTTFNALMPHLAAIPGIGNAVRIAAIDPQFADVWPNIIAALIPIIVFFMVPATFKFAGGLMSLGSNMINKAGKFANSSARKGVDKTGLQKSMLERQKTRGLKGLQNMPEKGGGFGSSVKRAVHQAQAGHGFLPAGQQKKAEIRDDIAKRAKLEQENAAHDAFVESNGGKPSFETLVSRGSTTRYDELVKQEASRITASEWQGQEHTKENQMRAVNAAKSGSAAEKIAAISFLTKTSSGRDNLREVKASLEGPSGAMTEDNLKIWRTALDGSKVGDQAPDLIKGNKAFSGVSPAEIASWDAGTTKRAVAHWNNLAKQNISNDAEYQKLSATMGPLTQADTTRLEALQSDRTTVSQANSAIAGIMEAPTLKAKFEPGAAAALYAGNDFMTGNTRATLEKNYHSDGSRATVVQVNASTENPAVSNQPNTVANQTANTTNLNQAPAINNISHITNQTTTSNNSSFASNNSSSSQYTGGATNTYSNRQSNASYTTNTVGSQQRVTFAPPSSNYSPKAPDIKVAASVVAPQGNVPQASGTPLVQPVNAPIDPTKLVNPDINVVVQRSGSGSTYTQSPSSDLIFPTNNRPAPSTVTKTASDGSTFKVTDRRRPAVSSRLQHSDADGNPEPGDDRSIQ